MAVCFINIFLPFFFAFANEYIDRYITLRISLGGWQCYGEWHFRNTTQNSTACTRKEKYWRIKMRQKQIKVFLTTKKWVSVCAPLPPAFKTDLLLHKTDSSSCWKQSWEISDPCWRGSIIQSLTIEQQVDCGKSTLLQWYWGHDGYTSCASTTLSETLSCGHLSAFSHCDHMWKIALSVSSHI